MNEYLNRDILQSQILDALTTRWMTTKQLANRLKVEYAVLVNPKSPRRVILDKLVANSQVERQGKKKYLYRLKELGETPLGNHEAENKLTIAINDFLATKKRQMKSDIETIESERNYYKGLAEKYKAELDNMEAKQYLKF